VDLGKFNLILSLSEYSKKDMNAKNSTRNISVKKLVVQKL